jgi:hypothetical protein
VRREQPNVAQVCSKWAIIDQHWWARVPNCAKLYRARIIADNLRGTPVAIPMGSGLYLYESIVCSLVCAGGEGLDAERTLRCMREQRDAISKIIGTLLPVLIKRGTKDANVPPS